MIFGRNHRQVSFIAVHHRRKRKRVRVPVQRIHRTHHRLGFVVRHLYHKLYRLQSGVVSTCVRVDARQLQKILRLSHLLLPYFLLVHAADGSQLLMVDDSILIEIVEDLLHFLDLDLEVEVGDVLDAHLLLHEFQLHLLFELGQVVKGYDEVEDEVALGILNDLFHFALMREIVTFEVFLGFFFEGGEHGILFDSHEFDGLVGEIFVGVDVFGCDVHDVIRFEVGADFVVFNSELPVHLALIKELLYLDSRTHI